MHAATYVGTRVVVRSDTDRGLRVGWSTKPRGIRSVKNFGWSGVPDWHARLGQFSMHGQCFKGCLTAVAVDHTPVHIVHHPASHPTTLVHGNFRMHGSNLQDTESQRSITSGHSSGRHRLWRTILFGRRHGWFIHLFG